MKYTQRWIRIPCGRISNCCIEVCKCIMWSMDINFILFFIFIFSISLILRFIWKKRRWIIYFILQATQALDILPEANHWSRCVKNSTQGDYQIVERFTNLSQALDILPEANHWSRRVKNSTQGDYQIVEIFTKLSKELYSA